MIYLSNVRYKFSHVIIIFLKHVKTNFVSCKLIVSTKNSDHLLHFSKP